MRVAIVSDYFLDYVGGAQTSMLEQKAALEAGGHVAFLVAAATKKQGRVNGLDLAIAPALTVPGLTLPVIVNSRRLQRRLAEFFYAEGIQAVHVQTEFGLAHAAVTAAHQLGLPVIHTVHTFYWASSGVGPTIATPAMRSLLAAVVRNPLTRATITERPSDNLLRNLTLTLASRADIVVSPSAHQAADLAAAGLTVPIELIPNPVSRSPRPATVVSDEQLRRPRVLWVARCEPEKRPTVFAEAAVAALARTDGGFAVDFVGDGSQLAEVRAIANNVENFVVHGSLDHDRVLQLMDESALVALTSLGFDNQPMTIAEAVSRYRGVLFCDPKLREGLGDSGFLSETPDAAGLTAAIEHLVTTAGALRNLSLGAQHDARVFSAEGFVDRVLDVYRVAARRVAEREAEASATEGRDIR